MPSCEIAGVGRNGWIIRRFSFLGFELYWGRDRHGVLRVRTRTAPKRLQRAKRRMKEWIRANRHLPARAFAKALDRKLTGHYNYYGVRGNERSLASFYNHAITAVYQLRNRRGGQAGELHVGPVRR